MKICLVNKNLFFKTVKIQTVVYLSYLVLTKNPPQQIPSATTLCSMRPLMPPGIFIYSVISNDKVLGKSFPSV